ncbi:MAG: nucleotide disphospho-sugar-binding domain-containing protein [Jatrophihabitantaceae bacterium]
MRVLVSSWGWRSHFYPLVPLAWALRTAGHEVLVASQPSMTEIIVGAGLPAVAIGEDLDFAEVFRGQHGRVATLSERARGVTPPDSLTPAVTSDGGVVRFAAAMVGDLVAFGREFDPDLIVFEPQNLAAAVTAAALGVPGVRQLWGPDETTQLDLDPATILGPLAAQVGVAPDGIQPAGSLILDPCPPGMQVRLAAPSEPVRFVPYNGPSVLPAWLRTPPERPRVCLTWGTVMAALGMDPALDLAAMIAEVASLDVELVLALHPAQHAGLTDLPGNVRLARTPLALQLVLPSCQAVIHQGGAGSMMTALAAGVPQVVAPLVGDQHLNAERLVAIGAGRSLPDGPGRPTEVRRLVAELLSGAPEQRRAAEIADQVRAMPAPSQVVEVLERLSSTTRTRSLSGAHL